MKANGIKNCRLDEIYNSVIVYFSTWDHLPAKIYTY
jgi:hypothetical protein